MFTFTVNRYFGGSKNHQILFGLNGLMKATKAILIVVFSLIVAGAAHSHCSEQA
jgi:hypothetical protein